MREHTLRMGMIENPLPVSAATPRLQLEQAFDEGIGEALFERKAHGHIDPARFRRQGVQQRQQQVFVREHDGRPFVELPPGSNVPQDRSHVLALHGIGDGGDRFDPLGATHAVVCDGCTRREHPQVVPHEHAGLLFGRADVIIVVIPVEIGLGRGGEEAEQPFLAGRECVESRHSESPGLREREVARLDAFDGGAVHHACIGDAELCEPLAKAAVDGAQRLPHGQEPPFLEREVFAVAEGRPERDDAQLFGRKVRHVGLYLLDVGQVAQQHTGIDQVFVDRVEIREQQLAPEVELIERLVVEFGIDAVKLRDKAHTLDALQARNFAHQLVHGRPPGLPQGTFGHPGQRIHEEQPGATRRKHHGKGRQVVPVPAVKIGGNLVQKTPHRHSTERISPPKMEVVPRSTGGAPR